MNEILNELISPCQHIEHIAETPLLLAKAMASLSFKDYLPDLPTLSSKEAESMDLDIVIGNQKLV